MLIKFLKNVNLDGQAYTTLSGEKSVTAEVGAALIAAGDAIEITDYSGYSSSGSYIGGAIISPTTGLPVVVGTNGTEYPLTRVSITHMMLSQDSSALANGAAISWDTVVRDDLGLTATNHATYSTRIYIPDTVKKIRINATATYAYVTGTPAGTYRGFTLAANANTASAAGIGLKSYRTVPLLNGTVSEAVVDVTTGLIDITGWTAGAIPNDNYLEMKTAFDGNTTSILKYGANGSTQIQVEMWE